MAGFGSVNWKTSPLFTKKSLNEFYPLTCVEHEPLVAENVESWAPTAYESALSEMPYDGGYPPLPTEAVGTEV
jgi:hypothetical protein